MRGGRKYGLETWILFKKEKKAVFIFDMRQSFFVSYI